MTDSGRADWVPERTDDGSWTLRHPLHGEACHSTAGAWSEAWERYVVPCALEERARGAESPLRLLDVGTGLGLNVAAAVAATARASMASGSTHGARLDVVTLESDASVLDAAGELARAGLDPGGERALAATRRSIEAARKGLRPIGGPSDETGLRGDAEIRIEAPGERERVLGTLTLVLGDARRTLPALAERAHFDAVFLDPFSPSRAPELWEPSFLREVARTMAPGAWLSTYSAAYAVRLGLARAGLRVGVGPPVGRKAEGTLASPDLDPPPLAPAVRARLERDLAEASGAAADA